ncbi:hypothetical protein [Candidatus Odyssella acanthamoebae]|nr:hypothetical protein [Candidatus Paracaedibacter acanthamoebae]
MSTHCRIEKYASDSGKYSKHLMAEAMVERIERWTLEIGQYVKL